MKSISEKLNFSLILLMLIVNSNLYSAANNKKSQDSLDKALVTAAMIDDDAYLDHLIKLGANVNSDRGSEALIYALQKGNNDMAKKLISLGANVNFKDKDEFTPLRMAIYNGTPEIIELLISKNVNIEDKDTTGMTPLMLAINKFRTDIMQLLLSAGADLNTTDNNKKRAVDHARDKSNFFPAAIEMVNLIEAEQKRREELIEAIKKVTSIHLPQVLTNIITDYAGGFYEHIPQEGR